MSQIFDALLRSETERAGEIPAAPADATKLLRAVENQAALDWAPTALLDPADGARDGERTTLIDPNLEAAYGAAYEASGLGHAPSSGGAPDLFSRLQSLPVALPSESRLVCLTDKENPTAEAFRLLGVRLKDLQSVRPLKKILITSTVPREGKSTVAANLACTLARRTGERTLLLDGDVRRPSQSQIFHLGEIPGLCDWLQGTRPLTECIYRLEAECPWIMPAGSSPDTPLELLQSAKLPALMEQLAMWFDWIVVDSPPVLPLADTSVWTRMVDGILLVTRQGVTEKRQLRKGLKALESGKLLGALMNCSQVSTYSSYYYRSSPAT